ncbi:uncharacterized protein LOC117545423 [Gymnodraco acuticeps]|uniref:Uncharacterized protein LOC117545423 n=1 Tax=Gymnodraco acuticeps TaxID=8218 RepID=A0A6P8U2Z6_GYMAC|nr:uncharacterized protein LOC117545423 [Gymnodraco acuticeps]XP_034071085.1 uncharacterized protein LOC117545423 [Gymnodraco acuticeps]XP_034071086.1 uncharacterized protein LOC117545423 [Gymnodraco acuticeps]XP_034071087.1 uncharacterized protein LOC117545423 [Gymnodraco acuticeps]
MDWEALQKQGEPTGSREVKKIQLLDSLEDRMTRDLRLTAYNTADDIFRVLENRYGNHTSIAIEIVEELQKMTAVRGDQPRKIVELIQTVEKALQDLSDLGDTGAIKNPLVTKSIESKLPDTLKKEWLVYATERKRSGPTQNRFDCLLTFLKEQESIYEQLEELRVEEPCRMEAKADPRHARTKSTKMTDDQAACVICGDEKHRRKLYFCRKFRALELTEKKSAVRKLGACRRCLEVHDGSSYCKPGFLCKNQDCRNEHVPDHHFYLCPKARRSQASQNKSGPGSEGNKDGRRCTEYQEDLLNKLPPELAKQCRDVFSNAASRTLSNRKDQLGLLEESGLKEPPVLMMLLEVTANAGQKVGTLIDLASDTNYIAHKAAKKLNLSEEITLVIHGIGGMKVFVETRRYLLKIRVNTPKGTLKSHQFVCYGLDSIADVQGSVTPEQLQKLFPDIPLCELKRPREISLLISHREGQLAPQRIRAVGDLVLWDGPLGKTVGGTHPDLFEDVTVSAHMSKTHFAWSMRAAAVKDKEVIGRQPPPSEQVVGRFWRDSEDQELEDYAVTRVNIRDKPAGCIAQLAMQETANLPPFTQLEKEQQVLHQDSYVDDIVTSHNDREQLYTITENVKQILKAGGFELKPWAFSGQSGRKKCGNKLELDQRKTMILPNQMCEENIGLHGGRGQTPCHGWKTLFQEKEKDARGQNLLQEEIRAQSPKNSNILDWWWIPDPHNIADIITRGASPQDLDKNSEWQNGPKFLNLPANEWPIKFTAREGINRLQKKAFVAALTRAKAEKQEPPQKQNPIQTERRPPAGSAVQNLVDVKQFNVLSRLVKTVAWIWRAAKKLIKPSQSVKSGRRYPLRESFL